MSFAMRPASPAVDLPDPDPRLALAKRVESLWDCGTITGDLLERARDGDFVIVIDFVEGRFDVSLLPAGRDHGRGPRQLYGCCPHRHGKGPAGAPAR